MADSVAKGQELFNSAQKKLKSFSFFGESPPAQQAQAQQQQKEECWCEHDPPT